MNLKKDFQKKAHYPKKVIWILVFSIIIVMFISSFFYARFIKKITYENVYHNITELSEQTTNQLNLSISNQMKFVDIMIDFLNGGYVQTIDEFFTRFNPDLAGYHFTRLVVLDEKGNGITSDGYTVRNYANMDEFFQQEDVYLSENRPSTVSDYQVNIYSKTFQFHDKQYVLFATIRTEDYKEILSRRLFHGNGGTYLINKEGSVLIDSFENGTSTGTNFYHNLRSEYQQAEQSEIHKIQEMSQNIQKLKNGTFDITMGKRTVFVHYEKLDFNQWYVVTLAPDDTIAKEWMTFLGISLGLCLFVNLMVVGVFAYFYFLNRRNNRKIYETAYIDSVTLLGNEIYFKENVSIFLEKRLSNKYIMILDINKFKSYNKQYDYEFCNQLLLEFGKRIEDALPNEHIVCRISRDIFAACFSYSSDIERFISNFFEKVTRFDVDGESIHLNIAIGIYKILHYEKDVNKILDKAYMAHSKIKGLYGNHYYIFDKTLEEKYLEEQKIESEMESALENHEFQVFYQPKVYTKDEKLIGVEALVRWNKDNVMIPPSKFIPLFEKNKFILKLDLYVFEKVCQDIVSWKKTYQEVPIVSVNVSKEHFIDENFIDEYVRITDQYHIDRSQIDLEITESATIDDDIHLLKILKNIKKYGFMISIDDFGTGYSSLSMLQDMPIDILKIDKVFVDRADLTSDENMINYIVFMAKKLRVKTIVEGVETKEQVEFMKRLKCDVIQGYYYSKPISKEDFEEYFRNQQEDI